MDVHLLFYQLSEIYRNMIDYVEPEILRKSILQPRKIVSHELRVCHFQSRIQNHTG